MQTLCQFCVYLKVHYFPSLTFQILISKDFLNNIEADQGLAPNFKHKISVDTWWNWAVGMLLKPLNIPFQPRLNALIIISPLYINSFLPHMLEIKDSVGKKPDYLIPLVTFLSFAPEMTCEQSQGHNKGRLNRVLVQAPTLGNGILSVLSQPSSDSQRIKTEVGHRWGSQVGQWIEHWP